MTWPPDRLSFAIIFGGFMVISIITIGIIDLFIAGRLLGNKDSLPEIIKVFAYIILIMGICEVSIFLSSIALILVPVQFVIFGLVFLREKDDLEFV